MSYKNQYFTLSSCFLITRSRCRLHHTGLCAVETRDRSGVGRPGLHLQLLGLTRGRHRYVGPTSLGGWRHRGGVAIGRGGGADLVAGDHTAQGWDVSRVCRGNDPGLKKGKTQGLRELADAATNNDYNVPCCSFLTVEERGAAAAPGDEDSAGLTSGDSGRRCP